MKAFFMLPILVKKAMFAKEKKKTQDMSFLQIKAHKVKPPLSYPNLVPAGPGRRSGVAGLGAAALQGLPLPDPKQGARAAAARQVSRGL